MITLRHLHAENFKGLRSVDLTLPERGSILIEGHNEAGKSTLFEAVYVALYGEPLVGEDSRPRLEEVIQHGQPQALVELTFTVGVQELMVHRVLRRQQTQIARLTIRRPDGTEDTINRPTAVNKRILQEFNNLDGDNLRNSCFVEQKELGRLEEMDSAKREQAIQKLLGLERLTKLADQFKLKREHERGLDHARHLLDLAHAQAAIRAAEADEHTLTDRLDAAAMATHLVERDALVAQYSEIVGQLATCERQEREVRARLAHASWVHEQLVACGEAQQQLEKAAAQREAVEQLAGRLAELDGVERESLPATRARLADIRAALELVIDAERMREVSRIAAAEVQAAQRAVEELEHAENAVRQRAEALDAARARAEQHRQETDSARDRNQRRLADLAARQQRLGLALQHVTAWEKVRERLEATQREVETAEEQMRALAQLRTALQQREEAARHAAEAAAQAERERLSAETRRRQAEGRAALQEWVRLKEVEGSLAGFAHDRTRLEGERNRAAEVRTGAQRRARGPLSAALAATLLAALAFAASAMWTLALALGGVLSAAAVLLWLGYTRARAAMRLSTSALEVAENRLRDLSLQYQAAVRAGGDPALLAQRERELAAAGFTVPPSLDAARALLAELSASAELDYPSARRAADEAVSTAARLVAEAERAQGDFEQTRAAIRAIEAEGNAEVPLGELRDRAVVLREAVEGAEAVARESTSVDLAWPVDRAQVQAVLAACMAEQQTVERALAEWETSTASIQRDNTAAVGKAERALSTANDAADAVRMPDPQAKLTDARAGLAQAEDLAREAEDRARVATQNLEMAINRAAVEAERGRLEERLRALESQVATRPALAAELASAQAALAGTLDATRKTTVALEEAARQRSASSSLPEATVDLRETDQRHWSATLGQLRAVLETKLAELDEQGAKTELETLLHDKGTLAQSLQATQAQLSATENAMHSILTGRHLPVPTSYTLAELATLWPQIGSVTAADMGCVQADLEEARKRLFAARDREHRLTENLEHTGDPLDVEECKRQVSELEYERAICQRASQMISGGTRSYCAASPSHHRAQYATPAARTHRAPLW